MPKKPSENDKTRKPNLSKLPPLPPDFCPVYCTIDEACRFCRHGRWIGFEKIRVGRWRTFKDGRHRLVEFASVMEDIQRLKLEVAASPSSRW